MASDTTRRQFLIAASAAATFTVVAGCSEPEEDPPGYQFEDVPEDGDTAMAASPEQESGGADPAAEGS
ncbi:uncharacterized protein NP_4700A [Natronomonas pharaonis DSM 2160]|uniref:Uncharacterized protein n=1 Tax=Natronomonas pharaonis (strain ATCC 35678 / DSM 2160 / CIP 103997 / JCM 8858 / NBRC 14720 / NCIMB 2260 / Gabara) TaxID=348780 RepID=A0A1U7EYV9_NATPD|nr:hypothetical protein [Natronomonas pharaonis]CAI50441.1 uncharacterized protein NP_4700A [Natronomonas pharaonis DSM 2160]